MRKTLLLCLAVTLLATPVFAHDGDDEAASDSASVKMDKNTGLDKASSDPVKYNSDGTERTDIQKEEAARRRMNGEGSSGPSGQEDMFPHNGKKH